MLDFLTDKVSKLFGNKSDKDIKILQPRVAVINEWFAKYESLSNDELRGKTAEFKSRIKEKYKVITSEIEEIQKVIDGGSEQDMQQKNELYEQLDKLEEQENELIEEALDEILPEAFAVIKETARRFMINESIESTATNLDIELAAQFENISISGDKVIYSNSWKAAGAEMTWNMLHYDVQLIGGMVLHGGKIAEMATGEGKTLVATLPAYLNALAGKGVHIVTVNNYLATRDSEWMAPIFYFNGLVVDCIDKHPPHSDGRKKAYNSDVTYGTNNEFGFDYLRDNMTRNTDELVIRKLHYAMVDEVDSVLIDDARTPLIISGPVARGDIHEFHELKPRIEKLVNAQKSYTSTCLADAKKLIGESKPKEAGLPLFRAQRGLPKNKALIKFLSEEGNRSIVLKTENHFMQDNSKEMPKVDEELFFTIDEKNNSIELTDKGINLITDSGEDQDFFIMPDVGGEVAEIEKSTLSDDEKLKQKDELMRNFAIKSERLHSVNQLLKAYTLFENDVEYILEGGKVKIVDEQTGRVMEGRRYSDGLHQAIEAKENVKVEAATQTYATVTLQNFFRMYHKLSGMTGTAVTEAGEFWEIYKLDVIEIPTNVLITRNDENDLVYKTKREKYNAVIDEVQRLTQDGRPVLVGTTSVEISELLSKMLNIKKIKHNVLNAKQHEREAQIVVEAGFAGNVTIATNMAGRGTDIKLSKEVVASGGLAIVGTERHESRRVDRQLRGRAGRQGDPGSSQFYVSLEDNLMRLFGSERIAGIMDKLGLKEGEEIQHSMITKSIERAQRKVEENNFGIRKRLLEYDDVMNSQREVIYRKRHNALFGDRLDVDLDNMFYEISEELINTYQEAGDYDGFKMEAIRVFSMNSSITEETFFKENVAKLTDKLYHDVLGVYKRKTQIISEVSLPVFDRVMQDRGDTVENVVVPFSDGVKHLQVPVNLKNTIETKGLEVMKSFEKTITLALIDETWKEHLREMDDLKQSVQAAVYEQKDPLLIYKFESFELFKQALSNINKDVLSFLFKGDLPNINTQGIQEAKQSKTDYSKVKTQKDEVKTTFTGMEGAHTNTQEKVKQQPVRAEQKVGRNDPCPCGSGKKFKQCHGKPGAQNASL
jgi:preprotein translocase subunit SecA